MSYHPTIGGRLREELPGVGRSQAACLVWGARPRKGDWSDLRLAVIVRRTAISDRSMVTAAKYVCSTWQFNPIPGEKMEKRYLGIDLHLNQFTCCIRLENGHII